ncbi:MAG: DsrE family protein [Burkholderiaceae bacterium]
MNRSHLIRTGLLVASIALFSGCAMHGKGPHHGHSQSGQSQSQMPRVVLQMSDNDPAKWNLALNNAKNVQNDYGADKVAVEIVAYGPGIHMLKADSTVSNRVTEATQAGVKVVACQNTMKGAKLTPADMNSSIGYVPSGVVELMERQKEGWSYIRP